MNMPPTELARELRTEEDPAKRRAMARALAAWRLTQGNPLAREAQAQVRIWAYFQRLSRSGRAYGISQRASDHVVDWLPLSVGGPAGEVPGAGEGTYWKVAAWWARQNGYRPMGSRSASRVARAWMVSFLRL
jgi:hypothetical protein